MYQGEKAIFRGNDNIVRLYKGNELIWEKQDDVITYIYYTTLNGKIKDIGDRIGGCKVLSNTYENGKGTIAIKGEPKYLDDRLFAEEDPMIKNNLTSIELPYTLIKIGDYCFLECTELASIELPKTIEELGYACFEGCEAFETIVFPPNITMIPIGCCGRCESLSSVTIPSNVIEIGQNGFSSCYALNEIKCYAINAPVLGDLAFYDLPMNGTLYHPSGSDYSSWKIVGIPLRFWNEQDL